jgi:pimeloyl-ACP methyl ester carboxylesterase
LTTLEQQTITETPSSIHEHWLQGKTGKTRYWLSEPRKGQPLLLIHGYGALIEHWRRLMPLLQEQHTVCAFDLHNFGYSSPLNGQPGARAWAQQAAQVIDSVLQEPPIVIGHSMGGMVAAQLAHDYPQLVRGLVLVDTTGLPGVISMLPRAKRAFCQAAQAPLAGELMMRVLDGPRGVRQFLHALYHRTECITPELVATLSGPFQRPHLAPFCLYMLRHFDKLTLDLRPGDVTAPTLIVWGANDPALSLTSGQAIHKRMFPHAHFEAIPNSGHCPFDETPEAFCDIVIPWFDTLLAKSETEQTQRGSVAVHRPPA